MTNPPILFDSLDESLNARGYFDELPALERAHLFDMLIQAHGLLSEVVDHLSKSNEHTEMLGMVRCAEQQSDFILTSFQNLVPDDTTQPA